MKNGNAFPDSFQPLKQCENQNKTIQEQCLRKHCLFNEDKFIYQALQCKEDHRGDGIIEKIAKLKCIQGVCYLLLEECNSQKDIEGFF